MDQFYAHKTSFDYELGQKKNSPKTFVHTELLGKSRDGYRVISGEHLL